MLIVRHRVLSVVTGLLVLISGFFSVAAQNECNYVGAPVVQTGAITGTDTAQTGRLFRDGRAGTCEFLRTPASSAGSFLSDSYTYTNTTGFPICVFVDVDAVGCGIANNQISIAGYLTSYDPNAPLTNLIGDPGLSTGQNFSTSMSFTVPTGGTYVVVVHNINAGLFCPSYTFRKYETNNCKDPGWETNGDPNAELVYMRPTASNSQWFLRTVATPGGPVGSPLGSTGDIPTGGDWNGDEFSDISVFRGSNGTWYTSTNPATNYGARQWGVAGDIPVQGDYDRDGVTDLAIYRPSTNRYFILRSEGMSYLEVPLGIAGDKPVSADFDGDGRLDPGVFQPSNGRWTWLTSAGNYGSHNQILYGIATDIPVPADYDGDGKADIALFRPSDGGWYYLRSSVAALGAGGSTFVPWGVSGDVPQPADYDGDRRADPAVFRPSTGVWWLLRSTAGATSVQFGQSGDIPVTSQHRPN